MGMLIRIVGAVWAVIGAANVIGLPWSQGAVASGLLTFGLIFNMVLFIIPGLLLVGLGARLQQKASKPAADSGPIEDRLGRIESLHESGMISTQERDRRRAEILQDV